MSLPTLSQIETMLNLQDSMNTKVNADWRRQNFAWYRAIWIECAELLDHYGWKWWKHQEMDRDQVVLCLLYTSPSPRDQRGSRMPSSA